MRRGFEGNIYCNTGTAAAPVWSEIDVTDDVVIEDDSEQIETTVGRSKDGRATKARGLASLKLSLTVESAANAPEVVAALLTAARERDAVADLFLSDGDASEGSTGVRMLACLVLTDSQPLGGRWVWKFDAMPSRAVGDWLDEGVAPLAPYTVPETGDGEPITTEAGDELTTEADDPILLEV